MSNMSYCRFHNTVGDFQDCMDKLEEIDEQGTALAKRARGAKKQLTLLDAYEESGHNLSETDVARYDNAEECIREWDNMKLSNDERERAYELIRMAKEMTDRFESLDLG